MKVCHWQSLSWRIFHPEGWWELPAIRAKERKWARKWIQYPMQEELAYAEVWIYKQLTILSGSMPVLLYGQSTRPGWAAIEELGEQAIGHIIQGLPY